jgi:hypothetical protein
LLKWVVEMIKNIFAEEELLEKLKKKSNTLEK